MKRFLLSFLPIILSFSGIAQIVPDSNSTPCFVDLIVTNQGNTYSLEATTGSSNPTGTIDYTWTINGTVDTTTSGDTFVFTGVYGTTHNVCVSIPCDTLTADYCSTIYIDSLGINPIDSLLPDSLDYGCLIGITSYGQAGSLSAYADFDGVYYPADLTWSIDGVSQPSQYNYMTAQMAAGTYYVCATYTSDSCTTTFCDSVVVIDPVNPIDSLNAGCLTNVTANGFGGQYFFTADFDNPNGIIYDVEWSIDGTIASGVTGSYLTWVFADGDYTVCASYITDSCTTTVCIDITVDNTINGNDSIIFIDSVGFGNWVFDNWDSLYVDSLLLDELEDWDLDNWSDSLLDIFFGDSININNFDSNDIYVLLDGLTQDQIDSLLTSGIVGFDLGDFDEYWNDFLEENEGIDTLGLTFSDLLGMFADYIGAKATTILSVKEVTHSNIDIFFNRQTSILTIDSDEIGQIHVYNIQGQRMLSQNNNNPQLNLSSINTGLYILSIEINDKVYSHKFVK